MDEAPSLPSGLMAIQPTILNFSSLLANVLEMEVEVVDRHLIRIAGTGPYSYRFGHSPESNNHLLRNVIETQKEMVVVDSRYNPCAKPVSNDSFAKSELLSAYLSWPLTVVWASSALLPLIMSSTENLAITRICLCSICGTFPDCWWLISPALSRGNRKAMPSGTRYWAVWIKG